MLPPGGRFRTRTDIITDHDVDYGRTIRQRVFAQGIRTCVLSGSVPITGLKSERAIGVSVGDA